MAQIGQDRGGFYSYDWLERAFGDDVHNADSLVPAWQQRKVGVLPVGGGHQRGLRVQRKAAPQVAAYKVIGPALRTERLGAGIRRVAGALTLVGPGNGIRLHLRRRPGRVPFQLGQDAA